MTGNRWLDLLRREPGHSERYIQRFRELAAAGNDLHGEARFVDAMVGRGASILDAGCGPGRVGGRLAELGHRVVGVDLDPVLIAAARRDHPSATWLVGDLADLHLTREGSAEVDLFDVAVCAGNVMAFLDPATRRSVLARLADHLATDGRIVTGFGAGRDYPFDEFLDDAAAAGLGPDVLLSTWDLRPSRDGADFLVAVLSVR